VESLGIVKLFGAVFPKNGQRAKDSLFFSQLYEPVAKRLKTKVERGDNICIGKRHIQVPERNKFRLSIRFGAAIIWDDSP
jgi:hypothetical protein